MPRASRALGRPQQDGRFSLSAGEDPAAEGGQLLAVELKALLSETGDDLVDVWEIEPGNGVPGFEDRTELQGEAQGLVECFPVREELLARAGAPRPAGWRTGPASSSRTLGELQQRQGMLIHAPAFLVSCSSWRIRR